ncbi:MAG: DUF58 domain-containing protein [Pseudomonadota bacterium]
MLIVVMLAAAVFGIDTRSTLAFQLFAITSMLLVVSFLMSLFFFGKFAIERKLPSSGIVGKDIEYICTVKNLTGQSKKGLTIIDELKAEFPQYSFYKKSKDPLDNKRHRVDRILGYPRLVNLLRLRRGGNIPAKDIEFIAANSKVDIKLTFSPLRRGYVYFDKLRIASAESLGLIYSTKKFIRADKLLILPKLYKTYPLNLTGHRLYQTSGQNASSLTGDAQEFISLREYRPGDPLRAIHWRSYAKIGSPVVKEYQDEYRVRYGLLLDTYMNQDTSDNLFEEAVSIAASYITQDNEQDVLMDLMFIGNQAYQYTSGRGHHSTQSMLEILACVESSKKNNMDDLTRLLATNISKCCGLVCVLLAWDEARQDLVNAIQEKGVPALVIVISDDENLEIEQPYQSIEICIIHSSNIQIGLNNISLRGDMAA